MDGEGKVSVGLQMEELERLVVPEGEEEENKWCEVIMRYLPCILHNYGKGKENLGNGNLGKLATESDEAFVFWVLIQYRDEWEKTVQEEREEKEKNEVSGGGGKKKRKRSNMRGKTQKSRVGLGKYVELVNKVHSFRVNQKEKRNKVEKKLKDMYKFWMEGDSASVGVQMRKEKNGMDEVLPLFSGYSLLFGDGETLNSAEV